MFSSDSTIMAKIHENEKDGSVIDSLLTKSHHKLSLQITLQVLSVDGVQVGSNGISLTSVVENASQTDSPSKGAEDPKKSSSSSTLSSLVPAQNGGTITTTTTTTTGLVKMLHNCGVCGKGFTEKHHMTRHERTVHECKKEYHCEVSLAIYIIKL